MSHARAALCTAAAAVAGWAAVPTASAATVNIGGLNSPTSFAWDDHGRVYIAEKAGRIKIAPSFASSTASLLLDMTGNVTSYGDHGLSSLDWQGGYLYATYSALNPATNNVCADQGQPNGRPPSAIQGCTVYGRLVRWPMDGGVMTGPEEVLVSENSALRVCAQFATGPIDYTLVDVSGTKVYFSAGTGANTYMVDYGQLGTDPCGTGATWGGAFRAQDLASLDGKVAMLDLVTRNITIVARGFNNPWRFALSGSSLFVGDTGVNTYEEISAIPLGRTATMNSGFPCYEGPSPLASYQDLNTTVCTAVAADANTITPIFSYTAPSNTSRVSISAVSAAADGRIYFGDYSLSTIRSIRPDGTDVQVVSGGPFWPVDMAEAPAPYGLVYVDVVTGKVKSVPAGNPPSNGALAVMGSPALSTTLLTAIVAAMAATVAMW